tara:strand:- start:1824 stop:3233 length:1410 start_codon:yes stop_codon:yes gene_type:complete
LKNYSSLKQIQQDLYSEKVTCEELVLGYLERIEKNKKINAFIETFSSEAIASARKLDSKLKSKKLGSLAGLVIGIKDNICYKDHCVSASSKILQGFISPYSATVVDRLIEADAIIIGRLNCDEFAMGSSNENSVYGPVKNPIDTDYTSGGSSGGSAAAVKANLCHASLGSDTGGSIRQPAAFCGVVGLKPTYGLVSRHGLIAFASSFDQIGPITKCLSDSRLIMDVISGKDNFDSTCIGEKVYSQELENRSNYSFAIIKDAIELPGIDPQVKAQFLDFIKKIKHEGHKVEYVDLPLLDYLTSAYYVMTTAEASSNLARYDGIKYGNAVNTKDLVELINTTRTENFGKEVKRRILLGTFVLSSGYHDAYYIKAQKIRNLIKKDTEKILLKYNYILLPTTPNLPFMLGEKKPNLVQRYYEDVFTVQANLSGHPAISFPLKANYKFLASAQLIGKYFTEKDMINTATQLSQY